MPEAVDDDPDYAQDVADDQEVGQTGPSTTDPATIPADEGDAEAAK